jgi:hypothetical protein
MDSFVNYAKIIIKTEQRIFALMLCIQEVRNNRSRFPRHGVGIEIGDVEVNDVEVDVVDDEINVVEITAALDVVSTPVTGCRRNNH